ncbi:hypothetical protein BDP27DRAFT_1327059 [Rhodocollybia butyracea]|uniref:Uncharacterized protein n=1 Tax=Rhodocollybia butyracea TaxID=206335 RepID=A0A9P5PTX0_9AGAR|nr:hypothetical protein BDP27DRAFT_1327059 [Rhodocollybia butyracea]
MPTNYGSHRCIQSSVLKCRNFLDAHHVPHDKFSWMMVTRVSYIQVTGLKEGIQRNNTWLWGSKCHSCFRRCVAVADQLAKRSLLMYDSSSFTTIYWILCLFSTQMVKLTIEYNSTPRLR